MKKTLPLVTTCLSLSLLAGCSLSPSSPLVVSKLFTADNQRNNVIELYNPSEEEIDLSKYSLDFYTNGAEEATVTMTLEGTIPAQSFFAIGSSNNTADGVLSQLDWVYEEGSLPFNGNDAIALNLRGKTIDFLGNLGIDWDYSTNVTLIRLGEKETFAPYPAFDPFHFISYGPELFQFLKNDDYTIQTLDDLYAGPQLEERYKEMPFVSTSSASIGGGGAILTTNTGVADGDTAYFSATSGFGGGSVRYYYLNTPEVQSSYVDAEPWGYVASKYNKEYVLSYPATKTIYLQSIPGGPLKEVNGRSLGLVWINGVLSQFLVVSEGLSEDVAVTYSQIDLDLSYEKVPYLTFLRFAEKRAKDNGWGTKGYPTNPEGEKSPDWNYSANNGVGASSTTTPVWTPHLAMPW